MPPSSSLATAELSNPLITSLNDLLAALGLPFVLETPYDLTSSLLLAILESILESRLPIPQSVRESRNTPDKIQAMKIFLGVLENDVIQDDVGLSDVDPRKLAYGEWDEVVFVGELLCWLGVKMELLKDEEGHYEDPPSRMDAGLGSREGDFPSTSDSASGFVRPGSPSVVSSLTASLQSALFVDTTHDTNTNTTILSSIPDDDRTSSPPPPRHAATITISDLHFPGESSSLYRPAPRCIHEIEDPSFLVSENEMDHTYESASEFSTVSGTVDSDSTASFYDRGHHDHGHDREHDIHLPYATSLARRQPIRHDGWIQQVDDESEIQEYEANRRASGGTAGRRSASDNKRTSSAHGYVSVVSVVPICP